MVLSVTLNPCIDKTIYLDNLEIGAYNRVKNTRVDLSGKGLNVSTVLNNLKEETMCMGLNFRESGNTLEHAMTARGLQYYFVRSEGAIRTNIKLFDQSNHILTEVNEAGPNVSFAAIEKLV